MKLSDVRAGDVVVLVGGTGVSDPDPWFYFVLEVAGGEASYLCLRQSLYGSLPKDDWDEEIGSEVDRGWLTLEGYLELLSP